MSCPTFARAGARGAKICCRWKNRIALTTRVQSASRRVVEAASEPARVVGRISLDIAPCGRMQAQKINNAPLQLERFATNAKYTPPLSFACALAHRPSRPPLAATRARLSPTRE